MNAAPHDLAYSDELISSILRSVKTIAMVGATPNTARPAHLVMKYLLGQGFRVIPINPGQAGKELLGQRVYRSLADVPEPIDMVDIFRRSEAAEGIVEEALALDPRPRVIWMQLGVRNDAAAAKAEVAGLTVIMNRCPKIEFGRLCGEIGWFGVNSRRISSRARKPPAEFQRMRIQAKD